MFIALRSDENIKGFKIENNEIKLTAFADDASYFLKDKDSAKNLLIKMAMTLQMQICMHFWAS